MFRQGQDKPDSHHDWLVAMKLSLLDGTDQQEGLYTVE